MALMALQTSLVTPFQALSMYLGLHWAIHTIRGMIADHTMRVLGKHTTRNLQIHNDLQYH